MGRDPGASTRLGLIRPDHDWPRRQPIPYPAYYQSLIVRYDIINDRCLNNCCTSKEKREKKVNNTAVVVIPNTQTTYEDDALLQ